MTWTRRILRTATAVYWLVLFALTHVKVERVPGPSVNDKLVHLLAYGLLAGLLCATLMAHGMRPTRAALWTFGLCLAYGAMDEWTQPWVGRSCELGDWLADAGGAAAATAAMMICCCRRRSAANA